MADVFISYQRKDRAVAARVEAALKAAGYSVWWDNRLTPQESWDQRIEGELKRAKCVLVLWSPTAVDSDWVRIEATFGKNARPAKLVQMRIEPCDLPIAFSLIQFADNFEQAFDVSSPAWSKTLEWIKLLAGEPRFRPLGDEPPIPVRASPLRHTADRDEWSALGYGWRTWTFAALACVGSLLVFQALLTAGLFAFTVTLPLILTRRVSVPAGLAFMAFCAALMLFAFALQFSIGFNQRGTMDPYLSGLVRALPSAGSLLGIFLIGALFKVYRTGRRYTAIVTLAVMSLLFEAAFVPLISTPVSALIPTLFLACRGAAILLLFEPLRYKRVSRT